MAIHSQSRNDVTAIRRSLHRNPDLAVLGNEAGAIAITDDPGYVWVRPIQAGGTFGKSFRVRGPLTPMSMTPGKPVKLGVVEGEQQVISIDFVSARAQGVNPTQDSVVDPNANNPSFVNQAFISTAYGQIVEGTLKVAIRGSIPLVSGTFVKVEGQVDFTGNVPSAGEHCAAAISVLSDLSGFEVQYSTPKSTQIPLDIDDLNEAWALMSDPLTNKPLWAFELTDGQSELIEDNRWLDIRQFLNWETSSGSTGDVVGPASATDNDLAAFDGTTGKLIKDSGLLTANVAKAVAALADKFLLQTADATNLPNAQAMGALATGIVKNTTTTGVQSIAAAGTDYTSPTGTENLSNKTITASTLVATALSLLIGGFKAIFSHANSADRTYTFPDATGNVLLDTATQNASNKTITSSSLNSTPIGASSASTAIVTALSILIGGFKGIFTHANSADRTYTLPDASGTVALTNTTGQGYVRTAPAADADNVVSAATTTIRTLALKTTDNNTTKKLLEFLSSAGAVLASIGATGLAIFAGIDNTPIGATTASTAIFSALSVLIGGFKAIFTHANTADRTYTLRDETGTIQMQRLTAKGDLLSYSTTDTRVAVGTDGQAVVAQAAQTPGLYWRDILYNQDNLIINGAMQLWSRSSIAPGTAVAGANDTYFADLWYALSSTGGSDFQTQRSAAGGAGTWAAKWAAEITATASNPKVGMAQIIEASVSKWTRSRTVRAQVRVNPSASSQAIRIALLEWTGTADSVTSDVVNNWASTNYTTGNFFKSTSLTLVATATVTPTANTATDLSCSGTVSSSCNNLIWFVFTEGSLVNGTTLDVSQCGIFDGADPVTWIEPDWSKESIRAQRFLKVFASASGSRSKMPAQGHATTTTNMTMMYTPPVPFRAVPTLTATGSDWDVLIIATNVALTAIAINGTSTVDSIQLDGTSSGMTAGVHGILEGDSGGDRYLIMSCEL